MIRTDSSNRSAAFTGSVAIAMAAFSLPAFPSSALICIQSNQRPCGTPEATTGEAHSKYLQMTVQIAV
jgi:hypothetical protein